MLLSHVKKLKKVHVFSFRRSPPQNYGKFSRTNYPPYDTRKEQQSYSVDFLSTRICRHRDAPVLSTHSVTTGSTASVLAKTSSHNIRASSRIPEIQFDQASIE